MTMHTFIPILPQKRSTKITQVLLYVMCGRLITHQMWMWRYFCIKPQLLRHCQRRILKCNINLSVP